MPSPVIFGLSWHAIVKNEEKLLPKLIEHLRPHVQEAVFLDTGSTDSTVAILRRYGIGVCQHPLDHDFAAARNRALALVRQPWVLQIDADEIPTNRLMDWVGAFVSTVGDRPVKCVEIRRHNLVGGQPIGDSTYEWHRRLFRSGLRFKGRLHEGLVVESEYIIRAPEDCLILHYKTVARQERQNTFYNEWEEQRANLGYNTSGGGRVHHGDDRRREDGAADRQCGEVLQRP